MSNPAYATATDLVIDRRQGGCRHCDVIVAKVIVFGCEFTSGPFETKNWTKPGKWTPTDFGETVIHDAPLLTICDETASSHADPDYEFTSAHLIAGGNLDWVSYDNLTKKIILSPTKQEYLDYHGQTITVKVEIFDKTPLATRPRYSASDLEFEIEFNVCHTSTL